MLPVSLYAGNIELEDIGITPTFTVSTWTWDSGSSIRVTTPTVDLDAANKWYVDNSTHAGGGAGYVLKAGDTMTGDLLMTNGARIDLNWQDILSIGIANMNESRYNADAGKLISSVAGTPLITISTHTIIEGELDVDSNKIVNLSTPTADLDAANKIYVDNTTNDLLDSTNTWTGTNTWTSTATVKSIYYNDSNTRIYEDSSSNMTFTDAVAGTLTLSELSCPPYIVLSSATVYEGDLSISDTNWNTSKAMINTIRVITSTNTSDWDLYILQNDNGYSTDDAAIPKMQLVEAGNGPENILVQLPYEDEDASGEVHLYLLDNSGNHSFDIYLMGYKLR